MEKLIIDRTKWFRGQEFSESYLRRKEDGKMCCLGFECLLRGLSEAEITEIKMPSNVMAAHGIEKFEKLNGLSNSNNFGEDTFYNDLDWVHKAAVINDIPIGPAQYISVGCYVSVSSEEDRENQIKQLFMENLGREVEFIN